MKRDERESGNDSASLVFFRLFLAGSVIYVLSDQGDTNKSETPVITEPALLLPY